MWRWTFQLPHWASFLSCHSNRSSSPQPLPSSAQCAFLSSQDLSKLQIWLCCWFLRASLTHWPLYRTQSQLLAWPSDPTCFNPVLIPVSSPSPLRAFLQDSETLAFLPSTWWCLVLHACIVPTVWNDSFSTYSTLILLGSEWCLPKLTHWGLISVSPQCS